MNQIRTTVTGGEPNSIDTTGLCLLSLDGGGVRGLSTLYILKSIMDRLNHARRDNNLTPVKPCEVFDLIGGTSTGGLIAIMLGRLEMDVDKCIDAYSDLTATIFSEKLSSIPVNIKGGIKARFDSTRLENAIRKVVENGGASHLDLFNDGTERGCRTFVCTADRYTKDIVRLRSYSLSHEPDVPATILQAALATSAATTFFEPVSIGDRSFADGGLGANNPVDEMEGEASNIWCPETGELKPLVKCFISIGTGNPGMKPFEDSIIKFLGKTVVQIATETENTEKRFIARWAKHFDERRYFRFNVDQGLQDIGLEEYKKKGPMTAATHSYLTHTAQKFRVRDCIQNMRLKQNRTPLHFTAMLDIRLPSAQQQTFLRLLYKHGCRYEAAKDRNAKRTPGTCNWFTNHELFKKWISSTNQGPGTLYVTADPGCGKSVLSRYLIESILPENGRRICYFFFKDDFDDQKTSLSALCTLIWQLYDFDMSLLTEDVQNQYEIRGELLFESFGDLWKVFLSAASTQETVFVIDALDECRERDRKQFVDAITAINDDVQSSNKRPRLKFLLTSRPFRHIVRPDHPALIHLQGDSGPTADAIAEEIQLVVNQRAENTSNILELEPDARALLKRQLMSIPNRTYLWITLVFDGLMDSGLGITKEQILKISKHLPDSVEMAYEKILSRSKNKAEAKRALLIILGAEKPLSLDEMAIALAIQQARKNSSDVENNIVQGSLRVHLRELCGLFVTIVDNKVYLLHQTAREFLVHYTTLSYQKETKWAHSLSLVKAHSILASICVWYLHGSLAEQYPQLLDYAANNWVNHYNQATGNYQRQLAEQTWDLCASSGRQAQWLTIYGKDKYLPTLPLHLASALGLTLAVEFFISEPHSKPQSSKISKGLREIFKLLLDTGKVDINAKDEAGRTPLLWAAGGGHEAIVKLLLDTGKAHINATDKGGHTPLSWAAGEGHEAIVKLLLDTGKAHINVRDKGDQTPISWGALRGQVAAARAAARYRQGSYQREG